MSSGRRRTNADEQRARRRGLRPTVGRVFGDRYEIDTCLRETWQTSTWRGRDLRSGCLVVIKTLLYEALSDDTILQLEHETRILRQIQTASLRPILDFARNDEFYFLIMPFIEGMPLSDRLSQSPLSVPESLNLGRDLFLALQAVHHQGLLHRDVKPENIIVDEGSPLTRGVLIDFGFAYSDQLEQATNEQRIGTARYVAPEQAGLLDHGVAEPSDLYSAGLVLYESLRGVSPFDGDTINKILRQQMAVRPHSLRRLGVAVPRPLDEVIQRLIQKDPRERYQTAEAVLHDLNQISEAYATGDQYSSLVVGMYDRRQTLTDPAFVGRQGELAKLEEQLRTAFEGNSSIAILEAESGVGKTRVLAEFEREAALRGCWVGRTHGAAQSARLPFGSLAGLIERIVEEASRESDWVSWLQSRLGDQQAAVAAALPALGAALGLDADAHLGPEAFGEGRTLQALTALFEALGSPERPALIVFDDCQWVDEQTLKLFKFWRRRCDNSEVPSHVMVLVAFRSEEVDINHPLRGLDPDQHLSLPPLEPVVVRQMIESMAGQLPPEAIQLIERLSDGSPFMASAVLRGMVESRALVAASDGWRIEPLAMDEIKSSEHAAAFLSRRIEMLPSDTLKVLTVAAVLGKQFDVATVANVVLRGGIEDVASALHEARLRKLVWARPNGLYYVFVHDRIRESLLARISDEERRELSYRAAEFLEKFHPNRVFELAYYFDASGDCARALPHALLAASQAREQHSLEIAEQQYRIAERGAKGSDSKIRFEIAEGLGDVLMLRGDYAQAEQRFFEARDAAFDPVTMAKIEGKLGELAFKRGDMAAACESLERGMSSLGRSVPRTRVGLLLQLTREAAAQLLHTIFPSIFLGRRSPVSAADDFQAIQLYSRLSYAYWFERGSSHVLWAHLSGLNLSERYPPSPEMAQAYSEHAVAISLYPRLLSRGVHYAKRSLAIRRQFHDIWGQGQTLSFYGVLLYSASCYYECIEKCREAVRLLSRTGDYWEMNIARYHVAACHYRLGDLAQAVAEVKRIYESGVELGDAQAIALSYDLWAKASPSNVDLGALRDEMMQPRSDVQGTAQLLQGLGAKLLADNECRAACDAFAKALDLVSVAGIKNVFTTPILPWRATALRRLAEQSSEITPFRRRSLWNETSQAVKRCLRTARRFRNDLPHALREAGIVAAHLGRPRRAFSFLEKSLNVSESQHARYEHAQTLVVRAQIRQELGIAHSEQELKVAQETLEEVLSTVPAALGRELASESEVTISLADRFDTVLSSGRQIASALTRDRIFETVHDATQRLLRAEHCRLWQVAEGRPVIDEGPSSMEMIVQHGDTIIAEAISSRRAVARDDELPALTSDAVGAPGARSVLCAPIVVRTEVVACLYVVQPHFEGFFGDEELRLADFITTLAGAALENAENFAQLTQLNETLEARVAQRTADVEARSNELAKSNEELEQFAYVVSHDMQEPLRTIASFCQLLERRYRDRLDETGLEFIRYSVEGAERMRRIISDLLTYSRVGTQGRPFEPVDCQELMERVRFNLRVMIEEKNAVFTHDELPVVMADETQLLQLFQNLVANGIKFHDAKSPHVHIGIERTGNEWVFSVRDNGIGIESAHFERIFLIFQRLHGRGKFEGTGIGLSVCKKTVERHGGKIWVDSVPGKGSTFSFTIPHRRIVPVMKENSQGACTQS